VDFPTFHPPLSVSFVYDPRLLHYWLGGERIGRGDAEASGGKMTGGEERRQANVKKTGSWQRPKCWEKRLLPRRRRGNGSRVNSRGEVVTGLNHEPRNVEGRKYDVIGFVDDGWVMLTCWMDMLTYRNMEDCDR
jgi:hypothetical protein